MVLQHQRVVHLVDVVAGKDQDALGLLCSDRVDVLEDSVRRALVPALGHALHRRQDLDEFTEFSGDHRAPALADVTVEAKRLVLREDVDRTEVGVDAIRQRDVDDAVLPRERNSGFWRGRGSGGTAARLRLRRAKHPAYLSWSCHLAGHFPLTHKRRLWDARL